MTQNIQGESGFDPSSVPILKAENNVISTPFSGVWQKTGWNTFAGTLLDIEYHNGFDPASGNPPDVSVFQFSKAQFIGRLTASGDQMVLRIHDVHFDPKGVQRGLIDDFPANGIRIPLEILPHTNLTLPTPAQPPQ